MKRYQHRLRIGEDEVRFQHVPACVHEVLLQSSTMRLIHLVQMMLAIYQISKNIVTIKLESAAENLVTKLFL